MSTLMKIAMVWMTGAFLISCLLPSGHQSKDFEFKLAAGSLLVDINWKP